MVRYVALLWGFFFALGIQSTDLVHYYVFINNLEMSRTKGKNEEIMLG